MPGLLDTALIRRRRARSGGAAADPLPAGDTQLITDLGGDSQVLAFYDTRQGVTVDTGKVSQWDDVRGAVGYAPSLAQATAGNRPSWDAVNETITTVGDGVTVNTLATAADATFSLSGAARALVLIASVSHPGTGNLYAAMVQDGAFGRYLGIRAEESNADIAGITTQGNLFPSVAGSTTRRIIIVAQNSSTGSSIEIPNDTKESGTGSAPGAGNNILTVGAHSGSGAGAVLTVRAVLWLAFEPSAGQVTTLKTYATTHHGAVLA